MSAAPGGLSAPKTLSRKAGKAEFTPLNAETEPQQRHEIGVEELDRVFGGGLVPSSATLIGGDPGIGKSTLLLQVAALLTSLADRPAPEKSVFFGEVALSGSIRPVARMDQRLKEAKRLGFKHAFVPEGSLSAIEGLTVTGLSRLSELVDLLGPEPDA